MTRYGRVQGQLPHSSLDGKQESGAPPEHSWCSLELVNWSIPSPGSWITALLGPTNTGKTHRCVSRMLEYDTGMVGLPLRLLAREVYDRIVREVGAAHVALVTGEEHNVPRGARYWVCTTEAMPTNLEVDFVGVDEIQLAAHPTRGHVFTERLLHARGRFETWFLGAATMRGVVAELVPSAHLQSATRLSKLSFTGVASLGQIPGRSAVVAFSVPQVYELAERLRVRKGGVAVVLGALSPKTRNAQVSMYQAGEVDHLVATDAIGMGLNMSISHVALAALHKFDGRTQRALAPAELAQIAGRAGRSIHDGTFGTIDPLWLDPKIAHEIEHHVFPQLKQVMWRSRDLDYSSLENLRASLHQSPKHPRLRLVQNPQDAEALHRIIERPEVKTLSSNEDVVRLLWEVCQIPDYRQLMPDLHAELLYSIFERLLATGGQLDDDWMEARLANLSNTTGDIDTLVGRIAFVRTWTYLSQRHAWMRNASHWQARTRALEDELSEALHERLIARFVSRRRTGAAVPRTKQALPAQGEIRRKTAGHSVAELPTIDAHHPFARLVDLRPVAKEPKAPKVVAARWSIDDVGNIICDDNVVARLEKGKSIGQPELQVLSEVSGRERSGLREAAHRTARQYVAALLADRVAPEQGSGELRGLRYQLELGLGTVTTEDVRSLLEAMGDADRQELETYGVVLGKLTVFSKRLLGRPLLRQRLTLARAYFGSEALPTHHQLGAVSLPRPAVRPGDEQRLALALGYVPTSTVWIRCDIAERVLARMGGPLPLPDVRTLASTLGCRSKVALRVAAELLQRAGLPEPLEIRDSRGASNSPPKRRQRFRRGRSADSVKQDSGNTVSSQK